jgi:protoporphyrinogen oxidase
MQEFDYIIIGGGISGLTFARLLQLHTNKTFLVLEKNAEIGGLCRTKTIEGNDFDIGGGHFLHSKHEKVYDFIFSHIAKLEFNSYVRNTKIDIHDTLIDFPLEDNLWQLPVERQLRYVDDLINNMYLGEDAIRSFKDWCYEKLGKEISENYMFPYNEKMWGIDLNELSTDWLYKLPKTNIKSILHSIILKKADRKNLPSHNYFYYPKKGGFQRITNAIYEPLKESVYCNYKIRSIKQICMVAGHLMHNHKWVVDENFTAKNIINTAPWESLSEPMNLSMDFTSEFFVRHLPNLKYTSLAVTYKKREYKTDVHWVYIPDLNIDQHRIFYVNNYADGNPDKYTMTERRVENNRGELEKFNTQFPDLVCVNEYAYPIPLKGKNEAMKEILDHYSKRNFYGLGRWGTWQHHNSDVCIFEAMELLNKLEGTSI